MKCMNSEDECQDVKDIFSHYIWILHLQFSFHQNNNGRLIWLLPNKDVVIVYKPYQNLRVILILYSHLFIYLYIYSFIYLFIYHCIYLLMLPSFGSLQTSYQYGENNHFLGYHPLLTCGDMQSIHLSFSCVIYIMIGLLIWIRG